MKATDIAGYAAFHGGLATPKGQSYPADTLPLFIAHGGTDTSITMDDVAALSRELEQAGVQYEIHVYSAAPHAFTVFGSDRYQKRADVESWDAFTDFLAVSAGQGSPHARRRRVESCDIDGRLGSSGSEASWRPSMT